MVTVYFAMLWEANCYDRDVVVKRTSKHAWMPSSLATSSTNLRAMGYCPQNTTFSAIVRIASAWAAAVALAGVPVPAGTELFEDAADALG